MTTTITIKDKAVNATYQNVTGLTGGAGVEATFDVTKTNGVYSVILDSLAASAGSGYVAGDTITLAGTALGGTVANNLIVTVATVGTLGKIATFGVVGTGRVGDGTIDVTVDVTGTAGVVSNETFIKHVYKNVFGTDATLTQVTDYTAWMQNSNLSQADVLVAASELAAFETTIGLVGLATTGIEYTPVV